MNRIEQIEKQTKLLNEVKLAVLTDISSLKLCLNELYTRQTIEEQHSFSTSKANGIGFNKIDAAKLTLYNKLLASPIGLSDKQILDCRKRIIKYLPQLIRRD